MHPNISYQLALAGVADLRHQAKRDTVARAARRGRPADSGGADAEPTPVDLFNASLATCIAFYTGRCLTQHECSRDDLTVSAGFALAADGTPTASEVRLVVGVSPSLQPGLHPRRHRAVLSKREV